MDKTVFYQLSYGVYVISAMDGSRPTGCVANSVMQITSDPSIVAVSLNHNNYTNEVVAKQKRLAVNILKEDSDPLIIGTFGFSSGREKDKFQEIPYEIKEDMPIIKDSCGYFLGDVVGTYETDTHTVFFVSVKEGEKMPGKAMTYEYYHKVIKGKSPKNAPTYQEEVEDSKEKQWVCSVCGYVYQGEEPFENLPEDYKCPVCKQPKSVFVEK